MTARAVLTLVLALACTAAAAQSKLDRPDFDKLSPESRRVIIASEYEELVSRARPSLNYVKARTRKVKGGYFLYATHRLFSKYEFDAGRLAPTVEAWVSRYQWKLKNAGIVRVGFRTEEGDEGWFTL